MYTTKIGKLEGIIEIYPSIFEDNRGKSSKPFHKTGFKELGIVEEFQEDLLVNCYKNVIRGMHFQLPPYEQSKLVYCIQGKIMDVVIDLRKNSPTYGQYECIFISANKRNSVYIPVGFAHGYLALEKSIVMYKMSNEYNKAFEAGIRWDTFGLDWRVEKPIISERDNRFEHFDKFETLF